MGEGEYGPTYYYGRYLGPFGLLFLGDIEDPS